MNELHDYEEERRQMVAEQIFKRGIKDERLLEVMRTVPRHVFVPPIHQHLAYTDGPLPIGEGQTISQPYIVALMTNLLALEGEETVLEIGTGSGYQAAVLGKMAKQVYTIERHAELAKRSQQLLKEIGINNVSVIIGDGSRGLPQYAPFEGILITAAAPRVPQPLFEQLAEHGKLVAPVGGLFGQTLKVWTREEGKYTPRTIAPVAFVPLRGDFGWSSSDWSEK